MVENKMQEVHAGYVSAALWDKVVHKDPDVLENLDDKLDWRAILRDLSHFVIDEELPPTSKINPLVAILTNLLTRGLPTLPSLFVEQALAKRIGLTRVRNSAHGKDTQAYETVFTEDFKTIKGRVEQALCVFAHGVEMNASPGFSLPEFGSTVEQQFFEGPLAKEIGPIRQLVERQRFLETIVGNKEFHGQSVDFCLEFPGVIDKSSCRGFIFEVDGPSHHEDAQKYLDDRRDRASKKAGWETIRIPVALANNPLQGSDLERIETMLLVNPYCVRLSQNFKTPLHASSIGKRILDLVVTPLAIARLHAVLLLLVRTGRLKLDTETWRICVIEREYPFALLATRDFRLWLLQLFNLYAPGQNVPRIEVTPVSPEDQGSIQSARTKAERRLFDALLDVSVLQRYGTTKDPLPIIKADIQITIRTGYRPLQEPRLISAEPKELETTEEAAKKPLTFFMSNIFRKSNFREGQLEIIQRTLRSDSSIVLLPTGAGKSLTYQLSALLQNGLVILIDPIKALMKDQVDNLRDIGIDCAAFINSTMKDPAERRRVGRAFARGHYKFMFVSPERLLIEEFRNQLEAIKKEHFSLFSLCFAVVDEAHCVSEWGHDFRTSYLRLGDNLRRHCFCPNRKIPVLALTGTASYEVLGDIKRELFLVGEDVKIIKPGEMRRDELDFKVVPLKPLPKYEWYTVAKAKQNLLPVQLKKIADYFGRNFDQLVDPKEKGHGAGLIFCPHVNNEYGVKIIGSYVQKDFDKVAKYVGVYAGQSVDPEENKEDEETLKSQDEMIKVQDDFKNSKTTVLVCTKAFGMGIDKSNIRFTVHFSLPSSIESFYQEAGRAGRDREKALCYILYGGDLTSQTQSVDFTLMQNFLFSSFRGRKHETQMIFDLLDETHFPSENPAKRLSDYLIDVFSIKVKCNPHHQNPDIVYINSEDRQTLGEINLRDLTISRENSESREVMAAAVEWLRKNCPSNNTWAAWFGTTMPEENLLRLEEMLANLNVGEIKFVNIPFDNGLLNKLTQYLCKDSCQHWTKSYVAKTYKYNPKVEEFIEVLEKEYRKTKSTGFTNQAREYIGQIFSHIRTEAETSRAIYRLSILGVIDDYTCNYNTKVFRIRLMLRDDGDIVKNLQNYIKRYYVSQDDADKVPGEIEKENAHTVLRKAVMHLISFVYDKIFSKREEALRTMEITIRDGVNDPELFKKQIFLYFDSRYTEKMRKNIRNYESETVFFWLDEIRLNRDNMDRDNMEHLLGSCNRLLNENPKNAAFRILRAFAWAFLPGPGHTETDVLQELEKAMGDFREQKRWSSAEEQSFLTKLLKKVKDSDPSRIGPFGAALVNSHIRWLQKFNSAV